MTERGNLRAIAGEHVEEPKALDRPPAFTDEALALNFAKLHAGNLRYVAAWSHWFTWTGTRWQEDDTLSAFDKARRICREAAAACNKDRIARVLASAKTVAAVERLAKSDRRLAATVSQWDTDPWALNTPGGTVDLRSGDMRQHDPADAITKITATTPDASAAIPLWTTFLDTITGGNTDLAGFLQRVVGYALTGDTREHALFFLYGTGANGKSTFVNTIAAMLGDYATATPIEALTASTVERHPTELADLRGARLAVASETEEGRRWAEARIKTLTGGDRVKARFMYRDFFEFTPQFKLLISGNHKPGLRSVDKAIRRRFNLIPLTTTIPAEQQVKDFGERLKAEWPGVLHWAVEGCLAWQQTGLAAPQAVQDATSEYLESEDALAAWIDERCERSPDAWTPTTELFGSWRVWAERAGEPVGSLKRFHQTMENRGFHPHRTMSGRGFFGVKITPADDAERAWRRPE